VLRTRAGVKPIYVSVGHRITLATARKLVLHFTPRYRHPEPLRAAHTEVNHHRQSHPRGSGDVRQNVKT
jgi:deoxyribonuclease V